MTVPSGDRRAGEPVEPRVARIDDIPAMFSVRTSVRENHLDLAGLAARGVTPRTVADLVRSHDARAWVIERGGEVVAFSMADARTGTVFALFVRPDAERRGFGRALLEAAERWLFDAGWETIWLQTGRDPAIRAHGVYRAAGWQPAGDADHDDVRYEKRRPD